MTKKNTTNNHIDDACPNCGKIGGCEHADNDQHEHVCVCGGNCGC